MHPSSAMTAVTPSEFRRHCADSRPHFERHDMMTADADLVRAGGGEADGGSLERWLFLVTTGSLPTSCPGYLSVECL